MSSSEHSSPEFQDDSLVPLPDPPPPPQPVNQFILSLDQHSANPDHLSIQLNDDQARKLDDQAALNHIIDDLEQLATDQHHLDQHHLDQHHLDQHPLDQQPLDASLIDEPALFNVENTRYLANPGLENPRYALDSGFENTRYLSDTTYDLPHQDSLLNTQGDEPSRSSFTQTFLRGILSSLESKDPVVANAWLETLLDAIDLLPVEVIRQEIISIAVAKGELSQPVCSRLASCQILGKLATKLDMLTVRQEILPVTLSLSQDIQWEVRKCMCTQLAYVSRGVGLDLTKSAVIPVLVELSNDKSVAVRVSAVETIVQILNLLDDSVCVSTIVPLVIKCCENARSNEDSTLAVIAKQYSALCHGLAKNLSQSQRVWLIQFFQYLATLGATNDVDSKESGNPMPDLVPRPNPEPLPSEASAYLYSECRQQCALNIPGVLLFTTTNNNNNSSESTTSSPTPSLDTPDDSCSSTVVSILCKLVRDPDACVRSTLASSLSQLVWILGARLPNLREEMVLLFNDVEVTVLTCMVNAMVFIIDALARYGVLDYGCTSVYGEELGFAILHMEEVLSKTRDWRLHSDCLEKISCLANCLSKAMIQDNFVPMLMTRATKSRPLPTRVAAVRTLLVILRFTIKNEHREKILHRIETDLKLGRSCHTRQLFLKLCEMSLMLFSKAYFKIHFFQHCISLYKDAVPNVRLRLVTLLPQVRATLQLPEDGQLLTMIESAIKELLLTEADRDVLAALQVSIGTIEEADLSSSSSNLPGLQAKEDERKEREEKLILNMESEPPETGNSCENSSPPSPISFQPAAPARLRTLAAERKRSESLPPSLKRRPLVERLLSAPPSPSLLAETSDTTKTEGRKTGSGSPPLWKSDSLEEAKGHSNSSFGYINPVKNTGLHGGASHLENIDQNAHEFLVDTGVILSGNNGGLRSSLPNLSMHQGVRVIPSTATQPIGGLARASTPPPTLRRGNSDLGISNILISNEEMQEYEKNFKRASSLSPRPFSSSSEVPENKITTSLHKSSISKMLKPKITQEVNISKEQSSSLSTPPNSSPRSSPKFSMRSSLIDPSPPRRWNDGTIERMAEKWAAKRDSLRRETGFVPENLQGRKATMEQRLESVKRSIPRGSTAAAQKRLSLNNDDSNKLNNSSKISPKRKSLDFESVFSNSKLPSPESKHKDDNLILSPSEMPGLNINKLSSPDFDSSDSDDSLPPYPSSSFQMDPSNDSIDLPDIDDLLPPPPPDIDENLEPLQDVKNLKLIRPSSSSNTFSTTNTTKYSASSKLGKMGVYPGALALPQKSLTSYYKTVPAPHTSVAVSKTLPSPRRSIAGSLKSPADLKINQIKAANELLIKEKFENENETKDLSEHGEVDNKINNDSEIEPNNNNIKKIPSPETAKLHKEIKRTSRIFSEQRDELSISKKHSILSTFEKVEGPNTTLEIIDCVEGPSQVFIKSSDTTKPNQFSRALKKPATSISLKDSEISPAIMDNEKAMNNEPTVPMNVKSDKNVITAASPVTSRKSTSTLPRSRLSASGGSKFSSHLQRRSYGGAIESKLSTPVSSTTSSTGSRFASAPSTPRTSTSDLRSVRSPGRSPIGSTTNLRIGSSQELRKGVTQELRKGVSQELRKGVSQDMRKGLSPELRKGSRQELNKPRLIVNSKPTSSNTLDQIDKHEITITSFDKQNPSQMIAGPKYSSQSNLETGSSLSSSKYHSRLGMNRYSLELGETKQASMKSIGSSLDFTSRHSSLPPSTPLVVSSNVSSTDRARMVGKPMLSHTTQSTTSYLTSSSKIIPMPETSPKNTSMGKSNQFGKHDINKNNQFVQGNRSMSSNALVHSPQFETTTSPSTRRHAMTATTTSSKVTNTSQLSSSKLVQANASSSGATRGHSSISNMAAKASKLKSESSKPSKGGDEVVNQPTQLMKSFAMRFSSKLAPNVVSKPVASPPSTDNKQSSTKTVTSSPSSKLTSPIMSPRQAVVTNPRQLSSGHLSPPPSAFSKMRGPSSKLMAASGSSKLTSHLASGSSSSKLSSLLPGSGAASSKKIAGDNDRQLRGPSTSSKLKSPGGHQLPAGGYQGAESNSPAKPVSAATNGVAKPLFTRQLKLPNSSKGLPTHKY